MFECVLNVPLKQAINNIFHIFKHTYHASKPLYAPALNSRYAPLPPLSAGPIYRPAPFFSPHLPHSYAYTYPFLFDVNIYTVNLSPQSLKHNRNKKISSYSC